MIIALFTLSMVLVFSKLIIFAIRMSWGILRVICSLILLPLAIIWFFVKGLVKIAIPILVIAGVVSIFEDIRNNQ